MVRACAMPFVLMVGMMMMVCVVDLVGGVVVVVVTMGAFFHDAPRISCAVVVVTVSMAVTAPLLIGVSSEVYERFRRSGPRVGFLACTARKINYHVPRILQNITSCMINAGKKNGEGVAHLPSAL